MEVIVGAKFRGEMPYEMHNLDIKLTDADLASFPELVTLQDRIDKAIAIGSKKCVAFGLAHQALTMEQAKNTAAIVSQIFINRDFKNGTGSLYAAKEQLEGVNHNAG